MDEQRRFYRDVEVVRKDSSALEPKRGHQRVNPDRLTGRLAFDLMALQCLHIGSGQLLPPEELEFQVDTPLVKAFFRRGNTLTIPGSSLKGALRSLVELFTYSCVCKTRVKWYDDRDDYGECRFNSKRHSGNLCPACKIFGAMGYQGQVRFEDAPQVAGGHELYFIPPQYKPRPDREYRRYYPYHLSDDRPRTWPLEVATVESRFRVEAQFTNLAKGELGLLLVALGEGEWNLCPRIGAGKSSGLGAVCVEKLVVEKWQIRRAYRAFESNHWEVVDMEECVDAAKPLLRIDVLAKLARELSLVEGA
jgi:hypothetical protein